MTKFAGPDWHLSKTLSRRFWKYVDKDRECWVWTGARLTAGYGELMVGWFGDFPSHRPRSLRSHVISWFLAHGDWPSDGLDVCHTCDNPPCVRPEHLFLGTNLQNARDAVAKGRMGKGLSIEIARSIREERAAGARLADLSRKFGVGISMISLIASGRRWPEEGHVDDRGNMIL